MNPIKVEVSWILMCLNANKKAYAISFNAIMDAWKALDAKYQEDYRAYSARVANQTVREGEYPPNPPPKPENRSKTYDFYIGFFENDRNTEQLLDEEDYRRFAKDDWEWMAQHRHALGYYLTASTMTADSTSTSTISADTVGTLAAMKEYYDTR
jgi:hypothetical protein